MNAPVFGERSTTSKIIFILLSIATGLYSTAAIIVAIMFSLSSFHHYQLIFYAIALVAMDILILTVVIPWRKQIVEDRVKYIAFLMLVPIFLMGLTIFVSTKYNGDGCLKCGNQICLSNGQTCVQCNTGYYLSYKDLANGIVNCLQVPLDPNRTEPDSCLRKIHF